MCAFLMQMESEAYNTQAKLFMVLLKKQRVDTLIIYCSKWIYLKEKFVDPRE